MKSSTRQRIAAVGIAAVAVIALQGTVSSANTSATSCQTWHPQGIVTDRYQHTLNPDNHSTGYQHVLNPVTTAEAPQHSWNPADAAAQHEHLLNPQTTSEAPQHTWNPAGDQSGACPLPAPATT